LLKKAEVSLAKGDFKTSLKLLDMAKKKEPKSQDDTFACGLFEIQLSARMGEFDVALKMADTLLKTAEATNNPQIQADLLLAKIELFWRSGDIVESSRIADLLEKHLDSMEEQLDRELRDFIDFRRGALLQNRGVLSWYRGEYDKALDVLQESLGIRQRADDKTGIVASLNNLGLVHWSKGNLKEALDYYNQGLSICESIGLRVIQGNILNNLGNLYNQMGDFESALNCLHRSLEIKEPLENKNDIATTLLNIGVIYRYKGDLDKASEYYQRCLNLSIASGLRQNIALTNSNIAEIYGMRGDLLKAEEYFQSALEIYREMDLKPEIARILSNFGWVYRKMDQPERALEFYKDSLQISEAIGAESLTATSLFELVSLLVDMDDISTATEYSEKLRKIAEQSENPADDQRYLIAKAYILKSSKKARDQILASDILEKVIGEEILDHALTTNAMLYLCDLLLSELRMTGDDETFLRVRNLTDGLLEIARAQSSYSLLAKTYLLQSKLALVDLDVDKAKELLSNAMEISQEKGLHMLTRAVKREETLLNNQLQKWESILELNPTKREMVDFTHLSSYIDRMIKRSVSSLAKEEVVARKYKLIHLDFLRRLEKSEKERFRVGLAQIGLAKEGNIVSEFYKELGPGLFGIKDEKVNPIRKQVREMIKAAHDKGIDVLFFPELTIDLNHYEIIQEIIDLSREYGMYIIPGSYHDPKTRSNICKVIGPEGILWEQKKHIPATIHYEGNRIEEGIDTASQPREVFIGNTEFGRIAITICRDFLDMDLRVELKNSQPPVDLVLNPAFTPVTTDFMAAHFDARRSIYAYCFFANVAEFGDSLIHSPEKDREERILKKGEEGILYKDVDLFQLRSERKRWEEEQKKHRSFIQSTR